MIKEEFLDWARWYADIAEGFPENERMAADLEQFDPGMAAKHRAWIKAYAELGAYCRARLERAS
jgi:hypothetical protein